jgi:hypothetical protein
MLNSRISNLLRFVGLILIALAFIAFDFAPPWSPHAWPQGHNWWIKYRIAILFLPLCAILFHKEKAISDDILKSVVASAIVMFFLWVLDWYLVAMSINNVVSIQK